MPTVFANKRQIIHKGDGHVNTCPVPDVCKTPSPAGPVPIPYVNIAQDGDLADGTTTVKVEGNMAAIKTANLKMSSGDEAGSAGGGIISSKIKGKMKWATCSPDVKFEGQSVIRFAEICLHNGNGDNTGSQPQLGGFGGTYPNVDEKCNCVRCGKPISTHEVKEIKQDARSQKAADDLHSDLSAKNPNAAPEQAMMLGVMVVKCPGAKRLHTYAAASGNTGVLAGFAGSVTGLGMRATTSTWVNTEGHSRPHRGAPPPGACAAAKLVAHAKRLKCEIKSMTELWFGPPKGPHKDKHVAESCDSCKLNLPQLLCSIETKHAEVRG